MQGEAVPLDQRISELTEFPPNAVIEREISEISSSHEKVVDGLMRVE
jgi:hypothetical protein